MKVPNATLDDIAAKLDSAIRLLALFVIGDKKQKDQISLLAKAGLDRHEIAEIVGTTPGTVSVELSNLKKPRKKKKEK